MNKKAKILLVDDEPGMLRYIRTLLEVDDHHVETAATGEEALEHVQKGLRPDLVLLDLLMPGNRRTGNAGEPAQAAARRKSGDAVLRQRHQESGAGHPPGCDRLHHQAISEGRAG